MTNQSLWFKRKKYGWGWTPANAKGWIVMLVYIASVSAYPLLSKVENTEMSMPVFLTITALLTIGLVWICYAKGEAPAWRWGQEDESLEK